MLVFVVFLCVFLAISCACIVMEVPREGLERGKKNSVNFC